MDSTILEYAPVIIVVLAYCFKNQIFVTPAQLTAAKVDLLKEVEAKFASKESADSIKDDILELKESIAELRNLIISQFTQN